LCIREIVDYTGFVPLGKDLEQPIVRGFMEMDEFKNNIEVAEAFVVI